MSQEFNKVFLRCGLLAGRTFSGNDLPFLLTVDDVEIKGVTQFSITGGVDETTRLRVEFQTHVENVVVQTDAKVATIEHKAGRE